MSSAKSSFDIDKRYMILMTKFHFMDKEWDNGKSFSVVSQPDDEKQRAILQSFLGATFYGKIEVLLPIVQAHQKFRDGWKSFIFDLIADVDREYSDEKIFLLALNGISSEEMEMLKNMPIDWLYPLLSGGTNQELQAEAVDAL